MRKLFAAPAISLIVLAVACSGPQEAQTTSGLSEAVAAAATETVTEAKEINAVYAEFLETYITEEDGINFVAYGDVTPEDHARLKAYVAALEEQGTDGLTRDEQMAFWFNLYNAKTIDVVLDGYPISSIRKLGTFNSGPWDNKNMTVTGYGEMSLNDVEHKTLRANWDEPRIHYAVNCASYGCPNLKATPWEAETLEADLEAAAIGYINHPRGFRVENGRVTASKIFNWYKEDFGGNQAGILEHARQYAEGDLKAELEAATKINRFEYNWDLNEG